MKKLYNEERDTDDYDNLVMKHMMAMTTEGLHSKAAISIELAYRDWQIEQLREALQLIKIKDENKMYQSCPDCDYPGTCKSDMVCKSMPRSSIGNIAHKVLEETK